MRIPVLATACLLVAGFWAGPFLQAAEEPAPVTVRPRGDLTADELANLLGVYVWKLDVSLPEDATQVSVGLYQQTKGTERIGFFGGISTPLMSDTKPQLRIAIIPIGGSLSEAEKVRVTIVGFGMIASGTEDNPLRGLGIGGPVGTPESVGDGTFHLLGGYKRGTISSPVSSADKLISFKIETR